MATAHKLYIIDISSFIFRAFFAIPRLSNSKNIPTNATYGVAVMLSKLADAAKPEYLAVVYDSKEAGFRDELYPEYKAHRGAAPDDLLPQFDQIEEMITKFKIPSFRQTGVEADDIIGTLAIQWKQHSPHHEVVIVSSDKDLMQLVDGQVSMWDTLKDVHYSSKEVEAKFGVKPSQIRDYLALIGDSSDNIPGVEGIGPKGAVDLLKEFHTLEGVLQAAADSKIKGKKGETLVKNKKDALLSMELVTLKTDLKLDYTEDTLRYHFAPNADVVNFLESLEFKSLVQKWKSYRDGPDPVSQASLTSLAGSQVSQVSQAGSQGRLPGTESERPSDPEGVVFKSIDQMKQLETLLSQIKKAGHFGFDLETTSLNPRLAKIVGVALCISESESWYIPVGHTNSSGGLIDGQLDLAEVMSRLRPLLESDDVKKIGQNLKYDFSVLVAQGLKPTGIEADTMVAAYDIEPVGRFNLKALALKYLAYTMLPFEEVCAKDQTFDSVSIDLATRYSAEDAWVAFKVWKILQKDLQEAGLSGVFKNIDLPLVEVLTRMEMNGIEIDEKYLRDLSAEFGIEIQAIEKKIMEFSKDPINLNSPKQLAVFLFEVLKLPVQSKTKTGYSTDASVLEILAPLHEVPRLLLQYREITKLKSTYIDPLPELKDPVTGRIHTSYHQTGTVTGRLSCSDPNLQNIPVRTERGRKIRRAFIAKPGHLLLSADYSQVELRILAHMSEDEDLVHAFKNDLDVHRRTAAEIFKKPEASINDDERGVAKAINFGLIYGKTAFGLSQELKISRKQSQEMIDRYFVRYHKVKTFLDGLIQSCRDTGYTETLLGRKRSMPEIKSGNHAIRANAERMAMNTPIQGTAADLMKLAMLAIDRALIDEGFASRLLVQVHDEVLLEVPHAEENRIKKRITELMEGALELKVPLRVNVGVGTNWMDL